MASNAVAGGDEVNACVIDLGASLCRAGYAGDDAPKAVFPSSVGAVGGSESNGAEGGSGRSVFIGSEALSFKRDGMEVVNPMGPDDLVQDWDLAAKIFSYALKERLRVDPKEMALLLAEPTHITPAAREKATEVLFESQGVPALFLAKAAVLSAFAVGRQTALVVDAGHRGTTVAAVHEGYVLNKTVVRSAVGGALLTRCMQKVLEAEAKASGGKLQARHMFKRTAGKDGSFQVKPEDCSKVAESYTAWALQQVAEDAKEALARAADTVFDEEEIGSMPAQTYELPDGTELSIGSDRFKVAETLFNSGLATSFPGMESDPLVAGKTLTAWPTLVKGAIDGCDGDVRREFWGNIVLTGGTSLLANARERLERDLTLLAPGGTRVKVMAPVNPTEKRFAAWIGGSILSSLGSFHQMWMSKAEFEEHGAALIHRKSP